MLEELLKQTEGKGINVYTHGEMLPAHGYPGLKKYTHLVGNYGGAWQDQHKEFAEFPGAIIFNTNCIQKPADSYKDRLFTWGLVHGPASSTSTAGISRAVIDKALECPGFAENIRGRRSWSASATMPCSAWPTRSSRRSRPARSSTSS